MTTETDLDLGGGPTLHVYDTGPDDAALTVVWHHGTPNLGAPPVPLLPDAVRRGIRFVSYDRPGYGTSSPRQGRDIASAAADVAALADALGVGRFAVAGHSGGAVHALAPAALLGDRVLATLSISALAPFDAPDLDWFGGMAEAGAAELRAAAAGRETLADLLAATEFDPGIFTPEDLQALGGEWAWLADIAGQAQAGGPDGMLDDDVAYVTPWGFDLSEITGPTLFVHGGRDRIAPVAHGAWLARRIPSAELWTRPDDGHVSILSSAPEGLDWLLEHLEQAA